jgi:anti-sigma B factor antagonist
MFDYEKQGDVIIVTPKRDLREFEFGEIETQGADLLRMIGEDDVRNIVIDFHKTDYYGSTALSFFVKLWKRVRAREGKMVFCNVSAHEFEILELTKLDTLWSMYGSREEALRAVHD